MGPPLPERPERPALEAKKDAEASDVLRRSRSSEKLSRIEKSKNVIQSSVHALLDIFVYTPLSYVYGLILALFFSRTSHRILIRGMILMSLYLMSIGLALIAFGGFYHAWIPNVSLTKDVWLRSTGYVRTLADSSSSHVGRVFLDGSGKDWPVWRREPPVDFFAVDQAYDVTLELRIPVNRHNLELDNFMADVYLETTEGTVLYESHRPLLLMPEPSSVRWLMRLLRTLEPSGRHEPIAPSQVVHVPLFTEIVPRASMPYDAPMPFAKDGYTATFANVTLTANAHVQAARLQFHARLSGIPYVCITTDPRSLMYYHPVLSLGVFVCLFSAVEFSVAGSMWLATSIYYSTRT
ncbi:lipid storage protein [Malassezia pachydermatis]